jgi:5-methylcytosine-specific restriction endonuclease McrA
MLPNAQNLQRSVAAAVSLRDDYRCRCCHRRDGLHHHHLTFRSKGGAHCTENELLLCKFCHALVHARQLSILGKNADKHLTFEIHEAAVVDIFGTRELPAHVRIVTNRRHSRTGVNQ